MFWRFFSLAACAEVLNEDNLFRSVNFITSESNTVHYIVTKWLNPEGNDQLVTSVVIYKDKLFDTASIVYNDKKHSSENTFFYTASLAGKYYIVVRALEPTSKELLLDYNVYSGASNRPNIVSSSDVEMMRVEKQMRMLLERAKTDIVASASRVQESESYKKIYKGIISKAVWIIIFKITVTSVALVLSMWKTKQFYHDQYNLANIQ